MLDKLFEIYENVYGKVENKKHWYEFMGRVTNGWAPKQIYKYISSLTRWAIREGRI